MRIALVFPLHGTPFRRILSGIRALAEVRPAMRLDFCTPGANLRLLMSRWRPDGVVSLFARGQEDLLRAVGEGGRPVVNIFTPFPELKAGCVAIDHGATGRMAADYLAARGFKHFGFFGSPTEGWSVERGDAFAAWLAERGLQTSRFTDTGVAELAAGTATGLEDATGQWIQSLPKPAAIFACNDDWAYSLMQQCVHMGLRVPDDVAVLGVDNDDLFCETSHPFLSSLAVPWDRIGTEAADLVTHMAGGRPAPAKPVWVPPTHVVTRQSTDVFAVDDEDLAAALRFIHDNAHQQIGIPGILRKVPITRRTLHRRFNEVLGRTPSEEIRRVRVASAKRLLAGTSLQMSDIAVRCGFGTPERMAKVFRQWSGTTPTAYRKASKAKVDRFK